MARNVFVPGRISFDESHRYAVTTSLTWAAALGILPSGCGRDGTVRSSLAFDSSSEMIAHARQLDSEILWLEGDIRRWRAPLPADLISSNAVLQRIPNHESLLLDWVGQLREGG